MGFPDADALRQQAADLERQRRREQEQREHERRHRHESYLAVVRAYVERLRELDIRPERLTGQYSTASSLGEEMSILWADAYYIAYTRGALAVVVPPHAYAISTRNKRKRSGRDIGKFHDVSEVRVSDLTFVYSAMREDHSAKTDLSSVSSDWLIEFARTAGELQADLTKHIVDSLAR